MRRALRSLTSALIAGVLVTVCLSPITASAAPTVKLSTGFDPDRAGALSTIHLGFQIVTPSGQLPSPVTGIDFQLPDGVTLGSNSLGLATCTPATLDQEGLEGCSPNSLMGHGTASVGVFFGAGIVYEPVAVTILMAPAREHHTAMLFDAGGSSPVIAHLVFPALLLESSGIFGSSLDTTLPLTPGLPGTPDAALVSLSSTVGPSGLTYYRSKHGKLTAYHPEGFEVPVRCPAGGYPFAANFTFQDGTKVRAASTAPCPPAAHHRARRR